MPATPTYALPYPAAGDPADVPVDMQELADRIEAVLPTVTGLVCIGEIDLASATAFSAIPQTYDSLRLIVRARTGTATKVENCGVRFNDDATAAYYWSLMRMSNNAFTAASVASQTTGLIGYATGSTALPGHFGSSDIVIPDYSRTGVAKVLLGNAHAFASTALADMNVDTVAVTWGNNSAITKITVMPTAGGTFAANSRAWLYGLRGV